MSIIKRTFTLPLGHANNKNWMDSALQSVKAYIKLNGTSVVPNPAQETSTYFEMSTNIHDDLKQASVELHSMFIQATSHVLSNPQYWRFFEFPETYWTMASKSFSRGDKTLTGRLDFSVSKENGIKCYEYNADSASCLMECGYAQGAWAVATNIDTIGKNPGEDTARSVTNAWRNLLPQGTLVHFLHDDDDEEKVSYGLHDAIG
jgi:glutathionylspermidine synthase